MAAKKSKYYDAALANCERAMRCYEKAGLNAQWEETVSQVRAEHHRKAGIMLGVENLVGGSKPTRKPSFMERAKARWADDGRQARGREPEGLFGLALGQGCHAMGEAFLALRQKARPRKMAGDRQSFLTGIPAYYKRRTGGWIMSKGSGRRKA